MSNGVLTEHELQHQSSEAEIEPPAMYKVILMNDDYTPMDFVVEILERYFYMNRERSTQVMFDVHTKGEATCGVFTYDIAETKVAQVIDYAQSNDHPLMCKMEEA